MAETSTPDTGLDSEQPSVEQRLANLFTQDTARAQHKAIPKAAPTEAPPETEQAEEGQAAAEEETAEDQPVETEEPEAEQPTDETWKIVHNGAEVELTREQVIANAQKGFDYERKSQALAEERKATQALLQEAQRIKQAAPVLMSELAQVRALESQLQQWEKVDWVQLATQDPLEYPKYRAQYDQLERSYRAAREAYGQKESQYSQYMANVTAQLTRQEAAKLPDLVPEFSKEEAFKKAAPEIANYLLKRGVPEDLVNNLNLASLVAVAYDGMRYSQLAASKSAVQKQVRAAAPMARPGPPQSPTSAAQKSYREERSALKRDGSVEAAAKIFARLGTGKR